LLVAAGLDPVASSSPSGAARSPPPGRRSGHADGQLSAGSRGEIGQGAGDVGQRVGPLHRDSELSVHHVAGQPFETSTVCPGSGATASTAASAAVPARPSVPATIRSSRAGTRAVREVLTQGRDAGVLALEDPADAANAILGGLLLAVLGRAMTGADPTDPRFRQHLVDQMLRGVVAG
jgi:hypothetical protein